MGLGKAFIMLKEKTFLQNQFSSSMHGKNIASKRVDLRERDAFLRKELIF